MPTLHQHHSQPETTLDTLVPLTGLSLTASHHLGGTLFLALQHGSRHFDAPVPVAGCPNDVW